MGMRIAELVYTHAVLLQAREYLVRGDAGPGHFGRAHPDRERPERGQGDREHSIGDHRDRGPFAEEHLGPVPAVPSGAFAEYDAHGVRPHHVHRGKKAHREAIDRLLRGFGRVSSPPSQVRSPTPPPNRDTR